MHAAAEENPQVAPQGIILSSPVVELRPSLQLNLLKNVALRFLLNFLPGQRISLETLGNAEVQVTSHSTHRGQMQHTAHYVPTFTLRLFAEIEQLIKQAPAAAARLHIPLLILYTPHDPLVSQEAVETFYAKIPSPLKSKSFFPQSYHLILHDSERARALQTVRAWLQARQP